MESETQQPEPNNEQDAIIDILVDEGNNSDSDTQDDTFAFINSVYGDDDEFDNDFSFEAQTEMLNSNKIMEFASEEWNK